MVGLSHNNAKLVEDIVLVELQNVKRENGELCHTLKMKNDVISDLQQRVKA